MIKVYVDYGTSAIGDADSIDVQDPALNAVLFDFNTTGSSTVSRIKALHAALIQEMYNIQANPDARPAQKRTAAIAITDLEKVQMVAVKALFAK